MTRTAKEQLFRTIVDVPAPIERLQVSDRTVMLGSCFVEHIGRRFLINRLLTMVNPLGVVYNPMSIARLLMADNVKSTKNYAERDGMWHTWLGDSTMSRPTKKECVTETVKAINLLHEELSKANRLFLTFGTNHYYALQKGGEVVTNCHRFPSDTFKEQELTVEEIVDLMDSALQYWHERNPQLKVVLTVSPYRYSKYGFHESQLGKSRLLLATDTLCKRYPEWVEYFPAYEIVMDELRDYRFYAADMLHPSEQAIEYIWQRLREEWMSADLVEYLDRYRPILQASMHKVINPSIPSQLDFLVRITDQFEQLKKDYPMLNR